MLLFYAIGDRPQASDMSSPYEYMAMAVYPREEGRSSDRLGEGPEGFHIVGQGPDLLNCTRLLQGQRREGVVELG